MAKNRARVEGRKIRLDVSGVTGSGTGGLVLSGDPVAVGQIPGVALTDEDSDTGEATIDTSGVYNLDVVGDNGSAAAISAGDIVYFDDAVPDISSATGGVRFGYALEDVASGATTEIEVKIGY